MTVMPKSRKMTTARSGTNRGRSAKSLWRGKTILGLMTILDPPEPIHPHRRRDKVRRRLTSNRIVKTNPGRRSTRAKAARVKRTASRT